MKKLKKKKKKKNCCRHHHFTHVYQKPQSNEVQFLRYRVRRNFFVILGNFLPFYTHPPNNPENHNFEKMKKVSGGVIILNLCNKKHNHMMYAYSDMKCDRHNFLSFYAIFCSFTPLLTPKIKIWKKCKKKPRNIILLHMCTINQDHVMYDFWDIKSKGEFLVILGNFCPLTLLKTQKIKILKK